MALRQEEWVGAGIVLWDNTLWMWRSKQQFWQTIDISPNTQTLCYVCMHNYIITIKIYPVVINISII